LPHQHSFPTRRSSDLLALFDPEIQVVAAAARLIRGYFFDLEVFRRLLDAAADAGQVGREQRRRAEGIERHADLPARSGEDGIGGDRKSTRLNSSHSQI